MGLTLLLGLLLLGLLLLLLLSVLLLLHLLLLRLLLLLPVVCMDDAVSCDCRLLTAFLNQRMAALCIRPIALNPLRLQRSTLLLLLLQRL
jgi:hypothetical protein